MGTIILHFGEISSSLMNEILACSAKMTIDVFWRKRGRLAHQEWIFELDNDLKHTSKVVAKWDNGHTMKGLG